MCLKSLFKYASSRANGLNFDQIKLKVLWIFKNIFKTLHDLNDSIEKAKMLKPHLKNSNRVKSYASFKIMQISI